MNDAELIQKLGGSAKVAELLGWDRSGGEQRVNHWLIRGIPAKVKLDHPEIFLPNGFKSKPGKRKAAKA